MIGEQKIMQIKWLKLQIYYCAVEERDEKTDPPPERSESIQPIRQLMIWDAHSLTQLKAMARGIMNVLQGRP